MPDAARPPLGCSFHPRCPRAFAACGWEARDLRDLLEARWARLGAEQYEAEQALFDGLGALDGSATTVSVGAGRGHAEGELLALLESVRAEDPSEPFWLGVRGLEAAPGRVEITFHEPRTPRLLPQGDVQVECHLYDPEMAR